MSSSNSPFEAKGLLFNKDELNYFFELPPDREPDTIIAVGDTAESGSGLHLLPVAVIYGTEVYIVDVVFDDAPRRGNKTGVRQVPDLQQGRFCYFLRPTMQVNIMPVMWQKSFGSKGYSIGIRTKRTISNKQTRIEFASDNIKKNFLF